MRLTEPWLRWTTPTRRTLTYRREGSTCFAWRCRTTRSLCFKLLQMTEERHGKATAYTLYRAGLHVYTGEGRGGLFYSQSIIFTQFNVCDVQEGPDSNISLNLVCVCVYTSEKYICCKQNSSLIPGPIPSFSKLCVAHFSARNVEQLEMGPGDEANRIQWVPLLNNSLCTGPIGKD